MVLKMRLRPQMVIKLVSTVFIKIEFNSDDNLPLNKTLKLYDMAIIVRSVFEEHGKFYPQVCLDDCLYEL